ncbi:NAD(P)H-binding protein [Nonomuraea sp. NPDC049152]|uniref:NAD(P)-dependent oxidoreductase n=1 Tax=Nonomuraea sp. NPDC049152 TaxID=3154350 RepID=UPI0033FF7550
MVFGATGGTGRQVVEQAVAAGHDVTVLARDPARVVARDRVTVIGGDVLTPQPWRAAVAGQDAVLSCLGSTDRRHTTTVYSEGTANILAAMRDGGVRRVLCLSSAGLEIAPGTPLGQRLVTRLVIQRLYRHGYADMARMERLVAAARDLDWTIVRPPMLTDGPAAGDRQGEVDLPRRPRPLPARPRHRRGEPAHRRRDLRLTDTAVPEVTRERRHSRNPERSGNRHRDADLCVPFKPGGRRGEGGS